jgi:hypothetical protein
MLTPVTRAETKGTIDLFTNEYLIIHTNQSEAEFGERVSARQFEGQARQMLLRCAALNRMTQLGMPDIYAV